ncbi:MAG: GxxExxY protein [Burkholderiales bacterium]|nr:GxxExxY protein [Bacteroidia bacterium]
MEELLRNSITGEILDSCIEVHRNLGPGLLESTYEICLLKEFELRGIKAVAQIKLPILYKDFLLDQNYIIDVLVADEFILELKSVEAILPIHKAQLITYLKLADKRLGFLINFNVPLMKNGFQRVIQGY